MPTIDDDVWAHVDEPLWDRRPAVVPAAPVRARVWRLVRLAVVVIAL